MGRSDSSRQCTLPGTSGVRNRQVNSRRYVAQDSRNRLHPSKGLVLFYPRCARWLVRLVKTDHDRKQQVGCLTSDIVIENIIFLDSIVNYLPGVLVDDQTFPLVSGLAGLCGEALVGEGRI